MFAVTLKTDTYPTYILADESASSHLEVVPQRGGMVSRWQLGGQEILYLDEARFANPELSVRGGIPILFPICGNLPNNTYTYNEQSYYLKQHGFARDLPWKVEESSTENCASLSLVLTSNEQTRQVYPFDWELGFTYQLQGNCLRIHQRYVNHSKERMPFSTGLHPYFLTQDKTQLSFEIPASAYQDQHSQEIFLFKGTFDFNREEIDVAFKGIARHQASLTDRQRQLKIELNYSSLYSTLVFWAVKGKDYVCLEPWSAPRNALNTGENLTFLAPHQSLDAVVEMRIG